MKLKANFGYCHSCGGKGRKLNGSYLSAIFKVALIQVSDTLDVASDVGVNLCNVKSCLNTSNNEIFTDKRGDLPFVNISKHTCPVVK